MVAFADVEAAAVVDGCGVVACHVVEIFLHAADGDDGCIDCGGAAHSFTELLRQKEPGSLEQLVADGHHAAFEQLESIRVGIELRFDLGKSCRAGADPAGTGVAVEQVLQTVYGSPIRVVEVPSFEEAWVDSKHLEFFVRRVDEEVGAGPYTDGSLDAHRDEHQRQRARRAHVRAATSARRVVFEPVLLKEFLDATERDDLACLTDSPMERVSLAHLEVHEHGHAKAVLHPLFGLLEVVMLGLRRGHRATASARSCLRYDGASRAGTWATSWSRCSNLVTPAAAIRRACWCRR